MLQNMPIGKNDFRNTTYTKLAQADTSNTIYTNVIFYFQFSFVTLLTQEAKSMQ